MGNQMTTANGSTRWDPATETWVTTEPDPSDARAREAIRALIEGMERFVQEAANERGTSIPTLNNPAITSTQAPAGGQDDGRRQEAGVALVNSEEVTVPRVTDNQEMEVHCPICFEGFDEEHAPRTLRCGHSVCTPCLEAILGRAAGDRNCPECRRPLKVTAAAHIPVSYTILRLSRALELSSAAAVAAEADIAESSGGVLAGEQCLLHHNPLQWWCPGCKDFQCRSCPHADNHCPERLPAKEAIIHLKQARVEETERTVLALNELKNDLETQRDKMNVEVDRIEESMHQLRLKMDKVQQMVHDVEDAEAQVVAASSACRIKRALAAAEKTQAAAQVWLEHKESRPASPIVSHDAEPLGFWDVCRRVCFTKEMYAVLDDVNGVQRFGRLTVEADKIIVHSFNTTPPPATAVLVAERDLAFPSGHQMTVFFDIHVEGRCEGRVTIVLFRQSCFRKSCQFLDTCKGSFGDTYKGLPVHSHSYQYGGTSSTVVQIGREIKRVTEYQNLHPRVEDDNYNHRTIYPGLVSGLSANYTPENENSSYPSPATFVVHLYSIKGGNDCKGFAKVLSGLGVLRYAMWNERNVVVGDCGIVLPMVNGLV